MYTNYTYYKTACIATADLPDLPKGEIVGVRYIGHRYAGPTHVKKAVYEISRNGMFWGYLYEMALDRFVF